MDGENLNMNEMHIEYDVSLIARDIFCFIRIWVLGCAIINHFQEWSYSILQENSFSSSNRLAYLFRN